MQKAWLGEFRSWLPVVRAMNYVREINDWKLHEILVEVDGPVVVYFFAGTVPDRHFNPEFEAAALSWSGQTALFYRMSAIEHPAEMERLKLTCTPSTVLFLEGIPRLTLEGPYSREALLRRIAEKLVVK